MLQDGQAIKASLAASDDWSSSFDKLKVAQLCALGTAVCTWHSAGHEQGACKPKISCAGCCETCSCSMGCNNTNNQSSEANNQISEWCTVSDHTIDFTGCCHFHALKML